MNPVTSASLAISGATPRSADPVPAGMYSRAPFRPFQIRPPARSEDTRRHTSTLKARMRELIQQLRAEGPQVTDPQARAILETSAQVLSGLVKSLDDCEKIDAPERHPLSPAFGPVVRSPNPAFLKHFGYFG